MCAHFGCSKQPGFVILGNMLSGGGEGADVVVVDRQAGACLGLDPVAAGAASCGQHYVLPLAAKCGRSSRGQGTGLCLLACGGMLAWPSPLALLPALPLAYPCVDLCVRCPPCRAVLCCQPCRLCCCCAKPLLLC